MTNLPKIALGAWAWGNDGTFGNSLRAENLKPIIHQILNRKWYCVLFKGKYNPYRSITTTLNILLLVSFALTAFCGMSMSSYELSGIFQNLGNEIRGIIWGENVWQKDEVKTTKAMEEAYQAGLNI